MADAQKVIELIFQGVDKTGAATQAALDNAQKFSGSLKDITQPISDFTVGALKLEAGLLTAGAAIVAFSVKSASDFDSAFRQISTIIEASDEDLAKFRESILAYASTSTQPLEQITNALGNAIGSGVDYAESLDLLATAEKLAVATRSDLDSTTKVLVSTLNSYGLGIKDAQSVSDLFFKIIDEGDISMTDLSNSFAKVAPIAKISGISLEEVGAAIATLTASGIKPAESIEYLRGAISNIISPTKQAQDLSAELGIQFNAAGLKANGLAGTLEQVALKTGGSADQMKLLFGDIGGFTAAATLAGPQAEKFRETLAAMGDVAGSTDEAFKKITGSVDVAGQKIAAAFNALTVTIGQPLLDEFGGIANAIAAIFQALGASAKDGALGELVKYIEQNLQGLQASIETVARNLPAALAQADFSGFQGGIDAVIKAFGLLFSNIDLSTVDGLTRAIELAGTAFLGLSKFTAGVIESFKPLFDELIKVGSGLSEVDSNIFKTIGSFAGFVTQLNFVLPALTAFLGLLTVKEGIGVVGALRAASTAAGSAGLAGSMASLVVAVGPFLPILAAVVTAVYSLKGATEELRLAQAKQKESQETQIKLIGTTGDVLRDFATNTGFVVSSVEEAQALIDSGKVVWDESTKRYVEASQALKDVGEAAQSTVNPFEQANAAKLRDAEASKEAALQTAKLNYEQSGLLREGEKVVPIINALTGKVVGYEKASITAAAATDKAAEALKKSTAESDKARDAAVKVALELEKLASNERIKTIESVFKFKTTELEEGTKRIQATFESIDNTVTSTGNLIGDLFGILKDYDSLSFGAIRQVEAQIEKENKARDAAFELQRRLSDAQIEYLRAQTRALSGGDALVRVDGSGLKPHLEAFMYEILKAIQVRVNADGLKMLLGT